MNFISSTALKIATFLKNCLLFIIFFLFLQSKLAHIGESRMEMDYKLVENEGLFQEYLEMGKYLDKFKGVFRTFELLVLTVIDCSKIAGAKAPIAPLLNTTQGNAKFFVI